MFFLHIGHAQAALLNDYFAHDKYKGTLLFRFDDTNSTKEKQEFQDSISEDLTLLGIKLDKTSYTSDHFQTLYEYCVRMMKEGNAYADDTDQKTMRDERMIGKPSARRTRAVEEIEGISNVSYDREPVERIMNKSNGLLRS
jgi:glutamyl-tRNA synthetase